MIFEARKESRRCTTVTREPNRVRKLASSIAVSPAADDDDLLIPEEEAVAGRAVRDAVPRVFLLTGKIERLGGCAGGDDDRTRASSISSSVVTMNGRFEKVDARGVSWNERSFRSAPPAS